MMTTNFDSSILLTRKLYWKIWMSVGSLDKQLGGEDYEEYRTSWKEKNERVILHIYNVFNKIIFG